MSLEDDNDLRASLRLLRTPHIGAVSFFHLVQRFGSAERALKNIPSLLNKRDQENPIKIPSWEQIDLEIQKTHDFGAIFIQAKHPAYPPNLKTLHDAPPILIVKGRLELLQQTCFSIVGARGASLNGKRMAQHLSKNIGSYPMVIVSGLARGIDSAAHEAAFSTGTIAVIPGGIDDIYPFENKNLYQKISEEGVLVSEVPFGTPPSPSSFPRRNRLISGLSWGVVVVEATLQSGSLLTAKYALEQGREVFAVPGHPFDPRSQGVNQLIQDGAKLVQKYEDILDHFPKNLSDKMIARKEVHYGGLFETQAFYGNDEYNSNYNGKKIEPLDFNSMNTCLSEKNDPSLLFQSHLVSASTNKEQDVCEILCESFDDQLLNLMNATPVSPDSLAIALVSSVSQVRSALVCLELQGKVLQISTDQFVRAYDASTIPHTSYEWLSYACKNSSNCV